MLARQIAEEMVREFVAALRASADLNQEELAERLGRRQGNVSRNETQRIRFTIMDLLDLCWVCEEPIRSIATLMRRINNRIAFVLEELEDGA